MSAQKLGLTSNQRAVGYPSSNSAPIVQVDQPVEFHRLLLKTEGDTAGYFCSTWPSVALVNSTIESKLGKKEAETTEEESVLLPCSRAQGQLPFFYSPDPPAQRQTALPTMGWAFLL